jgi:hypothetical protein
MSTNRNDGGQAYAAAARCGDGTPYRSHGGMALRDYFAAKAMQGSLSGHHAHHGHEDYWEPLAIAKYAYGIADAMLRARES